MLLTFEDIKHLVASKESNILEFKETTGQLTRGMESGCAFMNSSNNRIEIINTGNLPNGIDINNLTSPHKSIPCNPLIANVLYRRKMLENWGRGLELIYSECKRVGLPTPTLSGNQGEVVLTFFKEQVTEQVNSLIEILSDKEMSIKEILEALSLKHRPTLLYDYIQPAMQLGFVEQTQPDSPKSPTQKYRLTNKGRKIK